MTTQLTFVAPRRAKPPRHLADLTMAERRAAVAELGEKPFRADQLSRHYFAKLTESAEQMTDLPAAARERLVADLLPNLLTRVREVACDGGTTRKTLWRLFDGALVESVLMRYPDRVTMCVSSQAGCGMNCPFCATGQAGLTRNLSTAEIVEQVVAGARALARGEVPGGPGRVSNIVFMGMGEPLANYDNLMRAISIINAPWGPGIGARHITISTSGLVPRIRDLADQPLQLRLAISLHGATDEVRSQIMPVNRKYPLAELMDACAYFRSRKKQKITFEFILIAGVNDTPEQAAELSRLALRLNAKVNVIPYNTVEGLPWVRPDVRQQDAFMAVLRRNQVAATIRREKGHDISAACGQLRLKTMDDDRRNDSEKPIAAARTLL